MTNEESEGRAGARRSRGHAGWGHPAYNLGGVFGGAEVDEAFDAVDFADGDVDFAAEFETALVAAADEGGVVIGGVIEITR